MADVIHEITGYAQRTPQPYGRWADEVSRLMIETAERKTRIRELEAALRQICNEAKGWDVLIYEIARDALEPPR